MIEVFDVGLVLLILGLAVWTDAARDTFAAIKPGDGAIVGIYDRYSDQPAENAEYARRFGSSSQA